jgi:hypothetical protein
MAITIQQQGGDPERMHLLHTFATRALDRLVGCDRRLCLNITIKARATTLRTSAGVRDLGVCEAVIRPGRANPHRYIVTVRRDAALANVLLDLAHELIHVAQWDSGDLSLAQDGISRVWRGDHIATADSHTDFSTYRDLPWETEARAQQHDLVVATLHRMARVNPLTHQRVMRLLGIAGW